MHQIIMMMFCLLCPFLYSCDDDDDDTGSGGHKYTKDYIEVTFNGKTYGGEVPPIYETMEKDDGLSVSCGITSPQSIKSFDIYPALIYYTDLEKMAHCHPGTYRVVEDPVWGDDLYDGPEDQIFDFALKMDFKNEESFEALEGVNKVTKVTYDGKKAVVEGTYDVTMSNENFRYNDIPLKTFKAKGKYRMTIFDF